MAKKPIQADELGRRVDAHYKLYAIRKDKEKALAEAKAAEQQSADALLHEFEDAKLEGARGKLAQLSITRHEFVEITDFVALTKYVKKNDAFDLFERRVKISALRERYDAKKEVPGVKLGATKRLHLSTVKQD
jgi:hypothetical protein